MLAPASRVEKSVAPLKESSTASQQNLLRCAALLVAKRGLLSE